MFLITSGAYIDSEFASEMGLIPPVFLPLGNQFLFEHQVKIAQEIDKDVTISLPDSFQISKIQMQRLKQLNVELIMVDDNLTLGESISYCINKKKYKNKKLYILHGDTLFDGLDSHLDCFYISKNVGYYKRATMTSLGFKTDMVGDEQEVLSGYFSFKNIDLLYECIKQTNGDFIGALNIYKKENRVSIKEVCGWYDFGHINAYFNSRASFTTERSFNKLRFYDGFVKKSSLLNTKIMSEALWFERIPENLKLYTPRLINIEINKNRSDEASSYTLEYLYNLPLSDLCVYGDLDAETWKTIFKSCKVFCELAKKNSEDLIDGGENAKKLNWSVRGVYKKTIDRLNIFSKENNFDLSHEICVNGSHFPSLVQIATDTYGLIEKSNLDTLSVVHGDFCFSNILYDFRTRRIKVIDPRGIDFEDNPTNLGDYRYDLAKLYHSVYGLYDFIIAGHMSIQSSGYRFSLNIYESRALEKIQAAFDMVFFNENYCLKKIVHVLAVHLFLSMLPLHNDRPDRQKAMIATVARLYADLKRFS